MQPQSNQFVIVFFVIGSIVTTSRAAPTHYDQRQDGKFNVHANLENFVIIIAPITDTSSVTSSPSTPSSASLEEFDPSGLSLSALLEAFEYRKNLLAKNKLEHKSDKNIIDAVPEVAETLPINLEEFPKQTRSLKIKPTKKKAMGVTELTLIGESIENCGPGRFRDRSGICQFDGTQKN